MFIKGDIDKGEKSASKVPPRFFVMVPVYKVEKYLDRCIQSVLNQTFMDFRLILVDDGSPDRCGEICDSYAQRDWRITVVHQENRGLLAARRVAIHCAKEMPWNQTTYAVFLDSDDTLKENALEVIDQKIGRYCADLLIYSADSVQDGKKIRECGGKEGACGSIEDKRLFLKTVLSNWGYNPLWRKAVQFDLVEDIDYSQYYYISHGEDLLQSLPLYEKCSNPAIIPDSLYNYTVNPDSITHSVTYENYKINTTVRECVFELIDRIGLFTQEDYQDYRAYCVFLVWNQLKKMCSLDTTWQNKRNLVREYRETKFYQKYLKGKKYTVSKVKFSHKIIYSIFEKKMDDLLVTVLSARKQLSKIRINLKCSLGGAKNV